MNRTKTGTGSRESGRQRLRLESENVKVITPIFKDDLRSGTAKMSKGFVTRGLHSNQVAFAEGGMGRGEGG